MTYLITEMLTCLIIAAVIGCLVGWKLKKISSDRELAAVRSDHAVQLGMVESDRDIYKDKCGELGTGNASSEAIVDVSTMVPNRVATPTNNYNDDGAEWPYPVEEVAGIDSTYGNQLREIDITTTEDLLEKCFESSKQAEVANHLKVEPFVVSKWISMADLMRVPGIRGQYAQLLEACSIASVGEMARQESATLATKMAKVNAIEYRTELVPDFATVTSWVERARDLPTVIRSLIPK